MIRTGVATVAALAALAVSAPAAAQQPPSLPGADASILIDAGDGTPILQKDPNERHSIASATKLMTALLTLERTQPGDVFTAADYQPLPVESKIDLRPGERMRVDDLLEGLMLESANDAAVTLAEGISGSREAFVEDMNTRAADLGLDGTSYANPIGLDDPLNYSTARDLAALARLLLRDERFAEIVDMPTATLESGARRRVVANRNDLIAQVPEVDGVKTGYTGNAGYVLVGSATGSTGAQVISVVLGEPSEAARDEESLQLLRYGLAQYRRLTPVRKRRAVARVDVAYYDDEVRVVPARTVPVVARRDQRITTRTDLPDELKGDLAAGERVGTITILRDGKPIARAAAVTAERVPGAGVARRVVSDLGIALTAVLLLGMVLAGATLGIRLRRR